MASKPNGFGTRISLSERFSLIRKEVQKQSILVNPTVDNQQNNPVGLMKNFNGTVARSDRPLAALEQGSERNRRLILQMARTPNIMAQLSSNYDSFNSQFAQRIPQISEPNINQVKSIKQRLGATPNENSPAKGNIRSRLGIKRTPINQRIGLSQSQKNGNSVQLQQRNNVQFKRKGQIQTPKIKNQFRASIGGRRASFGARQLSQSSPRKRNSISGRRNKSFSAEQLDNDLDVYMQNTRSSLNADLDTYMSRN